MNLDSGVTEQTLDSLLRERGLSSDNILIKRGYAFVDLPDQNSLDKAIDSLHGKFITYRFNVVVVLLVISRSFSCTSFAKPAPPKIWVQNGRPASFGWFQVGHIQHIFAESIQFSLQSIDVKTEKWW